MRSSFFALKSTVWLVSSLATAQDSLLRSLDSPINAPAPPQSGVFGDLNGDGAAEAIWPTGVGVNDGNGWLASTPWTGPVGWIDAVSADVTGDGDPDFLAAAWTTTLPGVIVPYLSVGGPGAALSAAATGLPPFPTLPLGQAPLEPVSVDAGDIDGDGDADVLWLAVGTGPSGVKLLFPQIWRNDGGGAFSPQPLPVATQGPSRCVARFSDVDTDGDLDVVFATFPEAAQGKVYAAPNFGGGVFGAAVFIGASAAPTTSVVFADMNGDLARDVLMHGSGYLGTFLTGPGGLAPGPVSTVSLAQAASVADYDADGVPDLIEWIDSPTPPGTSGMTVHALSAAGVPGAWIRSVPSARPFSTVPASERDMDADGDLDAAFVVGSSLGFLMNGGVAATHTATDRLGLSINGAGGSFVVGDFDGDGDVDRVEFRPENGALALTPFLNDGHGFFERGATSTGPPGSGALATYAVAAFDRDGDGDDDLYFADSRGWAAVGGATDHVYDADAGAFAPLATLPGAWAAIAATAADADGDGDEDVFVARGGVGVSVALNDGGGGLSPPVPLGPLAACVGMFVADFDTDGDRDVLQLNHPTSAIPTTLFVRGTGSWTAVPQPPIVASFGSWAAASGDFDGDPLLDLAIAGTVFVGTASGVFVPGPTLSPPLSTRTRAADFDGDGLDDLYESSGFRRPCLGGGAFGPRVAYAASAGTPGFDFGHPSTEDFDRDGDIDVLLRRGNGATLLSNCTRQLASRAPARPGRTATLDLYGAPGGGYALYVATGPADFTLGALGTVFIDPTSAVQASAGFHPGAATTSAGTTSFAYAVPAAPAIIGLSLWWQAVDLNSLRVTNRIETRIAGY